ITDLPTRRVIQELLNLVETLSAEKRALQADNQRLRDEINRLKGEQGLPDVRPNKRPPTVRPASTNHSSEQERHISTPHHKGRKVTTIVIDRTEDCVLDRATLPPDAEFKGYETVIVQDLMLMTDNVAFRKEKWYAPSSGQTYLAPLPAG